jgi:hypothetical protein
MSDWNESGPDWSLIPEYMREGLRKWIDDGIEPGGFLQAVLKNQFAQAVTRADGMNTLILRSYAHFLFTCPSDCWGSEDAYKAWVAHHGLAGTNASKETSHAEN